MRLSNKDRKRINRIILSFDRHAVAYLFGSRVDNTKKGGDIDLLIESEKLTMAHKLDLLILLKEEIGDQKIDLLIKTQDQLKSDPFCRSLKKQKL